jgi:outer membrane protein OmpA-like peptidoglycan-associated protein
MRTIVKVYKGYLSCSYTTVRSSPVGNSTSYARQSLIQLEPRYRLFAAEEVTVLEYPSDPSGSFSAFILDTRIQYVELYAKAGNDDLKDPVRRSVHEILLLPVAESGDSDRGRAGPTRPLADFLHRHPELAIFYQPFQATIGKETHGRILAPAFVKIEEKKPDDPPPVVVDQAFHEPDTAADPLPESATTPVIPRSSDISAPLPQLSGCAPVGQSFSGCMPLTGLLSSGKPNGCLNSASGCLLPLLLLLLAAMLWWLLGGEGLRNSEKPPPIIIHDTIYRDVIRTDTLKIVKVDTLNIIDSTTTVTYETIDLPNVQFYSNSDVLLPSSATDLQQLAVYLTGNDSLSATIYGHTDSIGKPEDNLRLSQRRAESVRDLLVKFGVDGSRLKAVGMGDTQPRGDNATPEGRLMNRRVEVELTNTRIRQTRRSNLPVTKDKPDPPKSIP